MLKAVPREQSQIHAARNKYWPPGIRDNRDAFQQWQEELEDARRRYLKIPPFGVSKQFLLNAQSL